MYTVCCPNCSDVIHYGLRHPILAIATIALLMFSGAQADYFICNEIDLGTDERAEQYYTAILQAHSEIGFGEDEYKPNGLTIPQIKEIICTDSDEEALYWLNEHNFGIGRLYYYTLLATYHNWLHPEDRHFTAAQIQKNPDIIKSVQIDPRAYELATVAYFHNREVVNDYLLGNGDLPTVELDRVKELLAESKEGS